MFVLSPSTILTSLPYASIKPQSSVKSSLFGTPCIALKYIFLLNTCGVWIALSESLAGVEVTIPSSLTVFIVSLTGIPGAAASKSKAAKIVFSIVSQEVLHRRVWQYNRTLSYNT